MVVNQGLFATERGKAIVQEGLKQASTPLGLDGSMFVRTTSDGKSVDVIMIPLRAFGVKYVAMWQNETVVSLKVGKKAWANVYGGVLYDSTDTNNTYDPTGKEFDDFVGVTQSGTRYVNGSYSNATLQTIATLTIENSNGDESLDSDEKGYLILTFSSDDRVPVRAEIVIEIRLEKTAPLSIEFRIPEAMPKDTYVMV
jgi:archaellin